MPRMVRPERILFLRSVSSAILTDSRDWPVDFMNTAPSCRSQFRPQRRNRIERTRGFVRRINAKEQPTEVATSNPSSDGPERHHGRKSDGQRDAPWRGQCPAATPISPPIDANNADSMRNCSRISFRLRAQRLAHADLARPFCHRHQHDVHDDDAANHQRDGGNGHHHCAKVVQNISEEILKRRARIDGESIRLYLAPGAAARA